MPPVNLALLSELAPNSFDFGDICLVEFEPQSLWHEFSLTLAAHALKQEMRTEYHVFQHPPNEIRHSMSRLGIDTAKAESDGILRIIDRYNLTSPHAAREGGIDKRPAEGRPVDFKELTKEYIQVIQKGFPETEKRWLHIDDDPWTIMELGGEEGYFNFWRGGFLPWIKASERLVFYAIATGVASDPVYRKLETASDGIVDFRALEESGRVEHYLRLRMLRGKTHDSQWRLLRLLSNGEVVLDREPQREREIGIRRWIRGSKK